MRDTLIQEVEAIRKKAAELAPHELYKALHSSIYGEMRKVAATVTAQALSSGLDVDPGEFKKRSIRGRANNELQGGFVTAKAGNQYMGKQGQYLTRYSYKSKKTNRRTWHSYNRYKPIAMWAADGTKERKTLSGKRRGKMDSYRFFNNGDQLMSAAEDRIAKAAIRRIKKFSL